MPDTIRQETVRKFIDYQVAIDLLRKCAAEELNKGYRSHHNALIYAANRLENEQAFGKGVGGES